jgi:hypothetical protein
MPEEQFEKWLDIDNNAEVVAAMSRSIIKVRQKFRCLVPVKKKLQTS